MAPIVMISIKEGCEPKPHFKVKVRNFKKMENGVLKNVHKYILVKKNNKLYPKANNVGNHNNKSIPQKPRGGQGKYVKKIGVCVE